LTAIKLSDDGHIVFKDSLQQKEGSKMYGPNGLVCGWNDFIPRINADEDIMGLSNVRLFYYKVGNLNTPYYDHQDPKNKEKF
jgi:hypothetical protein